MTTMARVLGAWGRPASSVAPFLRPFRSRGGRRRIPTAAPALQRPLSSPPCQIQRLKRRRWRWIQFSVYLRSILFDLCSLVPWWSYLCLIHMRLSFNLAFFCVASMFQFVWSWPWPNQNIQHWVYLVLEIYKNRSISIFWLMNLANNRSTDRFGLVRPNAQTNEHVPHPTPTNMVQPPLRTLFLVPISLIFLYDGPMHLPRFLRYI